MTNTLILEKERFGYKKKKNKSPLGEELKTIGNDSLFYFAIFLTVAIIMQFLPVVSGLAKEFHVGINEVVVSVLGFANVFFVQLYNKKLKRK